MLETDIIETPDLWIYALMSYCMRNPTRPRRSSTTETLLTITFDWDEPETDVLLDGNEDPNKTSLFHELPVWSSRSKGKLISYNLPFLLHMVAKEDAYKWARRLTSVVIFKLSSCQLSQPLSLRKQLSQTMMSVFHTLADILMSEPDTFADINGMLGGSATLVVV